MAAIASVMSYEYAAGTCTLRLFGELSPLSQVADRPVLGRSRFHLQVQGDAAPEAAEAATSQPVIFEISGREPQFSALVSLVQTYVQHHLSAPALAARTAVVGNGSSLQPVGLTRHRLALTLPPDSPRAVELSTLQLSDLAEALEQADSNLQIVPDNALPKARRVRPKLPLWLGSVAAVGIAALLGNQLLTTAPSSVVLSPSNSQTTRRESAQPAPQNSQPAPDEPATATSPAPESTGPAPIAGEALPAPVTTAPTTPAASPGVPAEAPKLSRPPSAAPPAATSPQANMSRAATDAAPAAQDRGQVANSTADTAAAPPPTAPSTTTPRTARPETFEAGAGLAAPSGSDSDLAWVSSLTEALRQLWRPPADLAAPLRYRLTLAPEGTVTAVDPLSDFSATYQNTPTLPQPGTRLPGVANAEESAVEVQFLPSGEVVVVPPGVANP
ncbi:DUF4335 domain-containing protein [Nodosilinea nodulosa]|uniref:DUF4335 domain-containing protein n=1 Tax=Nodosilinea nodulosa TaxID=416001 RepID=UPI0002D808AC|nr:DUF4335 domain-containing protein [Nodosilinea nodulosa]